FGNGDGPGASEVGGGHLWRWSRVDDQLWHPVGRDVALGDAHRAGHPGDLYRYGLPVSRDLSVRRRTDQEAPAQPQDLRARADRGPARGALRQAMGARVGRTETLQPPQQGRADGPRRSRVEGD